MFEENDPPSKPKGLKPLDTLSVDELEEYVASLEAEIVRVKASIAAKQAHAQAAAAFFKR
jgi:uncharacterized small protein (DUF1192 family)